MPKKLPKGWSWPLKPSEVDEVVPGFGYLQWSGPWGPDYDSRPSDQGWLLAGRWEPNPGHISALRLTVYAVPSDLRQVLRIRLVDSVAPAIERWRSDADHSEGWRLLKHYEGWLWRVDGSVYRDPDSD